LSIGYANICSSVQDHRQKSEIIIRFWKKKREQKNQQKGSLKRLKRTAHEVKALIQSAHEVMTNMAKNVKDEFVNKLTTPKLIAYSGKMPTNNMIKYKPPKYPYFRICNVDTQIID